MSYALNLTRAELDLIVKERNEFTLLQNYFHPYKKKTKLN